LIGNKKLTIDSIEVVWLAMKTKILGDAGGIYCGGWW
jgi:hypothetical protein